MTKYLDYEGLQEFKSNLDSVLDDKVDAISGKGLSTNDFTTLLKNKLDSIEEGATANEGTVTAISVDGADYIPINGVVSLPNYPTTLPASDVSSWAKAQVKPSYSASEVGLDKVGNFKAVSTEASQGLSSTEQSNARANIGAGTSSLVLGTGASNAYYGDKGKIAYDHSQSTHARTDATKVEASNTNGNIKINGTETTVYTHPGSGTNPHGTTKSDVGLGNVGNFKAVSTVASQGLSDTEKSNARANIGAGTGTITGIKMNGASKGSSGVVDLGTVITAHQDISGKVDKTTTVNGHELSGNVTVTKSDVSLGNVTNDAQVKRTEMGVASGVATLDSAGKVPSSQLPSYVDDVLEYDTQPAFPETGEAGKIYVDKSTNTTWRWSGSAYTLIKGDLAIGTTTGTAADGGVANTHYNNTSNPHSVTKAQVGLGSVVNTGDSATPVSGGTTKFTTGGAYTELNKKVDKVSGKGLSTNDYTTNEKNKLSGIASGAQVNVIETVKVNGTALTPSSKAVNVTVPTKTSDLTNDSNFVSDTSYVHTDNDYTTTEKNKLSGIASGAEVNQNAFSNIGIKVGETTTTVAADTKTDTVTLIQGGNITLTPDTTNDTITIAAKDTTYSVATTSAAGLMSSSDKTKLNGIETGALTHKAPTTEEVKSALGTGSGTSKYLREDGTWQTPPDHIYTVNNGTFAVKGEGTQVASTSANASGNSSVDIVAGSNVTITPDATNNKITISSTDTNTWRPISDSVSSTDSSTSASSKAVKTAYDLAASKTSNTGTVTSVAVKMNGSVKGTITTNGTIDLGTVITAHQDISGKVDKTTTVNGHALSGNVSVTKSDVGLGNVTNDSQVKRSEMGVASGVATLDSNGKVPSNQLPSYVDDVIEGYLYDSKFYKESTHTTEITGETGKIYVDLSTNKTYRWGGSAYAVISETLALGETSSTAYRGDRGKTAYTHSQTTSGNPHNVTKSDVGLGNVGNFKAVSTVASQGLTDTEKSNARANIGAGTSSFSGSYNDLSNKPAIPAAAANGTYTVKTLVGSTTTNVSDFTANQSSADDVTFVQGSNVAITPDTTNRKITIAATDTTYKLNINGTTNGGGSTNLGTVYAPDTAGTTGQVLLSSGGKPNWKTGDIVHYVTSPSGTAGTKNSNRTIWTGTIDGVTALYTGLMILIKVPLAGVNRGVGLNVNNLGEHPVVLNTNSIVSTHYPVGTIMPLVYDADQKATIMVNGTNTEYVGCWKIANYDSNTYVTQTASTDNANYEVLFSVTADNTTRTEGARKNSNLKFNPSTGNLQATQLNGVTIGSSPKFTDTTYSSKSAASGGTDISLVTTGEKYTWNNKSNFSGSYNDLSNKPTIPAAANNGTFSIKTKVGSNSAVTAADFTANQSSADDITLIQGNNVTLTTDTTNRTVTIAATDTTYSAATTSAAGLMSATDKSKLDGIASGATANTGTITGIKMNGASKGTSGVVDLGTVITAHQNISGKVNTSTTVNGHALTGNVTVTKSDVGLGNVTNDSLVKRSEMGAASGVATLDSNGKVPSSQLPSYVDDVIEAYYKVADGKFYTTLSSGTYSGAITGETGKIYVDLSTSRTYRWGGSAYAEIKASPGTLDDITDGSTYVRMTSAERTKLSGIATGATANTGTITKVGNTSSGAVTVSSSNNTASFGNAVTVGSVGGVNLKFTMPDNPNTNTWRPIQVGGTDKLTDSSTKLNFTGSGATSVSYSNGTVTISSTDNNTVTSINGKTGAIAAADIATVLTGAGYKLTDTNTHYTAVPVAGGQTATSNATSATTDPYINIIENSAKSGGIQIKGSGATSVSAVNGVITISSTDTNTQAVSSVVSQTGAVTAAQIGTALTNAGYKLTDTNTWKAATTSQEGYVPTLALSGTSSGAKKNTINTQASDYVLTYTSGTETAPVWRKLPANAYANSTYTVNNGTFTVKGAGTAVSSTSANASGNTAVDFVAGSNVTITPDATNGKITIAAKDTTYSVVSTSANGLAPKVTDTSKFLKGDGTWATPTDTNNRRSFYGTCDTAAATAEKAVTISDTDGWELKAGTIVGIKFTYTNTASNVTLNVNSSGAKSIWYNNAAYTSSSSSICGYANRVTYYMYDGTQWVWLNMGSLDGNTDTKVTQTVTTTSADYEVLFSATADNTTRTEAARKNSNLKFNPSTGNLQATQLNGVTIGSSPKFTDTTYSSKAAASGGTDVSLVTTGEKYTWNSKTSNTGTVTKVTAGTGLTGGDITTTGTIALATSGVTAGTYKRVTVDAYGRVTSGDNTDSDTKNTAGTTNKTGTKMFLAAATEQSANPVTYSNSNCYIGTDNCLYSGGAKVLTSYTNTTYAAGTGVTITGSNNAINVTYGTAANTACQGNDSRLSNSRPASDVYSWAKLSSKPSYSYGEISYSETSASVSGAVTVNGSTPVHVLTATGNISSISFTSGVPVSGHSCHIIITAASDYTAALAHGSTVTISGTTYTFKCPGAEDLSLNIKAGGFAELDLLRIGNNIYVRGV